MIKSTIAWLGNQPRQRIGLRILQTAIGGMLLFRTLTEFSFSSYLWDPQGIATGGNRSLFGSWLGDLLDLFFVSNVGVKALLAILAGAALALVLGKATRIATIVACVAFIMFENRLPELFDGGDNITRLTLCYLVFAMGPDENWRPGDLKVWVHNLAIVAVACQLMVLYVTSGFVKITGEAWHGGTAMYLISQVETYSLPQMRELMKNGAVVTTFAFTTMFFQIWFPVAVMSRLKFVWLAAGIGMHFGIAVMMGLVSFSSVMIGLELFLITDEEFKALKAGWARLQVELGRRAHAGAGTFTFSRWILRSLSHHRAAAPAHRLSGEAGLDIVSRQYGAPRLRDRDASPRAAHARGSRKWRRPERIRRRGRRLADGGGPLAAGTRAVFHSISGPGRQRL